MTQEMEIGGAATGTNIQEAGIGVTDWLSADQRAATGAKESGVERPRGFGGRPRLDRGSGGRYEADTDD